MYYFLQSQRDLISLKTFGGEILFKYCCKCYILFISKWQASYFYISYIHYVFQNNLNKIYSVSNLAVDQQSIHSLPRGYGKMSLSTGLTIVFLVDLLGLPQYVVNKLIILITQFQSSMVTLKIWSESSFLKILQELFLISNIFSEI